MLSEIDVVLGNRYHNMMSRCYNVNCSKYKNYGARGVTVCDRWKNHLSVYRKDVKLLCGYDEKLVLQGKLQLDKDYRNKGNKVYSPETCIWVTERANAQVKPSYMWWHYGWDTSSNTLVKFYNIEHFCSVYKQKPKNVSTVSTSKDSKLNKGWLNGWFFWSKEHNELVKLFTATNVNNGVVHISYRSSELAKMINSTPSKLYTYNRKGRSHMVGDWYIENKYISFDDLVNKNNLRQAVIY